MLTTISSCGITAFSSVASLGRRSRRSLPLCQDLSSGGSYGKKWRGVGSLTIQCEATSRSWRGLQRALKTHWTPRTLCGPPCRSWGHRHRGLAFLSRQSFCGRKVRTKGEQACRGCSGIWPRQRACSSERRPHCEPGTACCPGWLPWLRRAWERAQRPLGERSWLRRRRRSGSSTSKTSLMTTSWPSFRAASGRAWSAPGPLVVVLRPRGDATAESYLPYACRLLLTLHPGVGHNCNKLRHDMHIGERGGHTGLQWYLGGGMTNMSTDNMVPIYNPRSRHACWLLQGA